MTFYLPREFGCILLFGFIFLPAATHRRLSYTDAPVIVLGDLNQCNLESLLPGFEQYVKTETRKDNIPDKCFVNVNDA